VIDPLRRLVSGFVAVALFLSLLPTASMAQVSYTFSGTIRDKETGEILIGASVIVGDLKTVGVSSNAYGFYSLTVPEGTHIVLVQFIGYRTPVDTILFNKDMTINFNLSPDLIRIHEVVVSGERSNKNVTSTEMSSNKLEVHEIQSIPVLLG
jgi:hypothetical protein